jgi:hypothetical protein
LSDPNVHGAVLKNHTDYTKFRLVSVITVASVPRYTAFVSTITKREQRRWRYRLPRSITQAVVGRDNGNEIDHPFA